MRALLNRLVSRAREWDAPLKVKLAWGYLGLLALLIVGSGLVYAPLVLLVILVIVGGLWALFASIATLANYYP